jgi:hypothetical protein
MSRSSKSCNSRLKIRRSSLRKISHLSKNSNSLKRTSKIKPNKWKNSKTVLKGSKDNTSKSIQLWRQKRRRSMRL